MITEKINAYIRSNDMLRPGDGVIVGFSGGADSVCLLRIMTGLREKMELKILAVHIVHGIRGETAEEDAVFSEEFCRSLDVPFRVVRVRIPLLAKQRHLSVEEAGRQFRYETFERIRRELRYDKIAVAHHADDNAETVIANLCRGTGLSGAGGMEPVQGSVIRPLLCVRRHEIETYLSALDQPYRTDETNDDVTYTRNRIRHEIIPRLEEVNAQAVSHLNEASRIFREAENYAVRQTEEAAHRCLTIRESNGAEALFDLQAFELCDPFIRERLLLYAMEAVCGRRKDLGSVHVKDLIALIGRQSGRRIDLPYGMRAVREYGVLRIYRPQEVQKAADAPSLPGDDVPVRRQDASAPFLTQDGAFLIPKEELHCGFHTTLPLPTGDLKVCVFEKNAANFGSLTAEDPYTKYVDCDKIEQHLCIRICRPQDVIALDPQRHHKSVRRYLMEHKVPAAERNRVWAAADGGRIIWMIGGRIGRDYYLTQDTAHVLKMQCIEKNSPAERSMHS